MVDQKQLFDALGKMGVDFFTGVPDSLLNDFCLYMVKNIPDGQHVMAANEGNAIGIAAGHYMATGNIPVVYMQNSGIGNATNPLLSLTHDCVYGIPMVLVIGWRGDPAISDHAQHKKQGELTPVLMKDMDIPYEILDAEETVVDKFAWAVNKAKKISSPVALIAKKAILTEKIKKQVYPESPLMNREEAVSAVVDVLGSDAVYLGTTGRATREVHEQLKAHGVGEGHEFQNVGSMGHVSSVGLGIALAKPEQKVVVFDGDAAAVMHLGALATNCRYKAGNLVHIVLNNGVNESVGGQPSAGYVVNLTAIAKACGYRTPGHPVETKEELQKIVREQGSGEMPLFIDVHVRQGIRSDMPKLNIDHKAQKVALMENLKINKTMKKAIVLGGTYPHSALIQKLKARGYYTILVDYLDHPAAKPFADEHIQESTLDMDKVCQIAKEQKAELVISTCIDQANVTCCYVAERLGLPKPYSYETSLNVTDKVRMKRIMIENGIPTARHYQISSIDEFAKDKLRYPIIVKPADANSSKGVRRIDAGDENAENYIKDALRLSRNGKAIVEEFIIGREIGADCMIVDGKAHVIMTRERRKINKNNTDAIQQIYGSFWPADLSEKNIEELRTIAEQIAKAFGIFNAPLMMQTILSENGFDVIEFGARIGGGDNYQIIEELTEYDIIQNSIHSFLGEPIQIMDLKADRPKLLMDNYIYVMPPKTEGAEEQVFGRIEYAPAAKEFMEYEKVYRLEGDSIGYKISSNNRVGCFVVRGKTEQELLDKQMKVVRNMEVYDIDGNPIMRKDIY